MSDSPKYSGVGPHGTVPARTGKSSDQMMAEAKAAMKERRKDPIRYFLGDNPKPERVAEFKRSQAIHEAHKPKPEKPKHQMGPEDYPWLKPGWKF